MNGNTAAKPAITSFSSSVSPIGIAGTASWANAMTATSNMAAARGAFFSIAPSLVRRRFSGGRWRHDVELRFDPRQTALDAPERLFASVLFLLDLDGDELTETVLGHLELVLHGDELGAVRRPDCAVL